MRRRLRAEVAVEIRRPIGDVFTALCEARAWPMWMRRAGEVRADPPGPIRGGSVLAITARGMSLRRTRQWQVTDLRPDRLIALEDDGASHRLWFHLEPGVAATLVTVRVEIPYRGLIPIVRRWSEQAALRADLRLLRSLLESPAGVAAFVSGRPSPIGLEAPPLTSLEGMRRSR